MPYLIAKKNEETGKFELITDDKAIKEYYSIDDVIHAYEPIVEWSGRGNVFIIEKVALNFNVSIKPHGIDIDD